MLEYIERRRRQIHTHSIIYYHLNTSLITDAEFDKWSNELVELNHLFPEHLHEGYEHEMFADWTGDTGMHLPVTQHSWNMAHYLIRVRDRKSKEGPLMPPLFGRYVVGFAFDQASRVALIKNNRPAWQEGRLNGIGGKIEEGESAHAAMVREFDEEAGVLIDTWELYATVKYPEAEILFFKAEVPIEYLDNLKTRTDEEIMIFPAHAVNWYETVGNLSWLLPLALYKQASYLPLEVVVTDFGKEGNDV